MIMRPTTPTPIYTCIDGCHFFDTTYTINQMNSSLSWHKFLASIPSFFFNLTLRFSILRAICIFAILLLCNVPTHVLNVPLLNCDGKATTATFDSLREEVDSLVAKYERMRTIYSYLLYSFTLLHHFASAFGPRLSLPGIVDLAFIVGEIDLFILQAISGRWAVPIPRIREIFQIDLASCQVSPHYLEISTAVAVFTWTISLLLILLAIMRIAEALRSNGKYLWTTYDIAGFNLTPRHNEVEKRPNGLQVLVGVRLWEAHFKSEGKWMVLSRGIVAFILVVLLLGLAFNSFIIDPIHETDEVPVKVGMSRGNPGMWTEAANINVVVGVDYEFGSLELPIELFDLSIAVTVEKCTPTPPASYALANSDNGLYFTNFLCGKIPAVSVSVDFTRMDHIGAPRLPRQVQVIIGHSNDILTTIRRTELPVVLTPGMDLFGFARQHKVRQFRNPGLSAFGLFAPSDEFLITEITHLQPNVFRPLSSSLTPNNTASLVVFPRGDYSDIRTIQDYRDKSVLKAFSSIGGLWTVVAFIFSALFGSSLVRVTFGVKPISIVGLAHNAVKDETLQKYRDTYPFLESDIAALRARPGLLTLLVNHLIDLDLLTKAATQTPDLPDACSDEHELMTMSQDSTESQMPIRGPDLESMLESPV